MVLPDDQGCTTGTANDILNVYRRNNEPSYVARQEVNILDGFESINDDDFVAYTDNSLGTCAVIDPANPPAGTYYRADVITANDYYPGGMQMPGRTYSIANTNYRYGFNGKEKDDKDGVVQYDYGFRIYDSRLVRFKSLDPLQKKFPELSPYQFASNSPIAHVDLDGKEAEYYTITTTYTRIHRTNEPLVFLPTTTTTVSVKHENTGFFKPNGALGAGTMYTIQTQTVDVYKDAMGIPQEPKVSKPITVFQHYEKPSASGKKEEEYEGIVLYSSDGQGEETRKGKFSKEMVDIGGIIAATRPPSEVKLWEVITDKLDEEFHKEEETNQKSPRKVTSVCPGCHSGDAHPAEAADAYEYDENGKLLDTLKLNSRGKVDTLYAKKNK